MKNNFAWGLTGVLLAAVFLLTMLKPPSEITQMLTRVSGELTALSLLMHLAMLTALALGFILPKARTLIFTGMMALLAGSAALVGGVYILPPNLVLFGLYFWLILHAHFQGRLGWDLSKINAADWLFGLAGLIFGFWYLHWVNPPLMLNALFYSPLGVVNCPTILAISGFLCLSSTRPAILEFTSGLTALYFGIFGIVLLGAYVDAALVLCGLYQLWRFARSRRQRRADSL